MKLPRLELFGVVLFIAVNLTIAGCASPQQAAYEATGTVSVTAEAALQAYDVFAAQGKTTVAENAAVKAAYLKYQAAFAVVCDAGAIYAATSPTNAAGLSAASAAVQEATANANAELTDLENLVKSFGVTLN